MLYLTSFSYIIVREQRAVRISKPQALHFHTERRLGLVALGKLVRYLILVKQVLFYRKLIGESAGEISALIVTHILRVCLKLAERPM